MGRREPRHVAPELLVVAVGIVAPPRPAGTVQDLVDDHVPHAYRHVRIAERQVVEEADALADREFRPYRDHEEFRRFRIGEHVLEVVHRYLELEERGLRALVGVVDASPILTPHRARQEQFHGRVRIQLGGYGQHPLDQVREEGRGRQHAQRVACGSRVEDDPIEIAPPYQLYYFCECHDLVGPRGEGVDYLAERTERGRQLRGATAAVAPAAAVALTEEPVDRVAELLQRRGRIDLHRPQRSLLLRHHRGRTGDAV